MTVRVARGAVESRPRRVRRHRARRRLGRRSRCAVGDRGLGARRRRRDVHTRRARRRASARCEVVGTFHFGLLRGRRRVRLRQSADTAAGNCSAATVPTSFSCDWRMPDAAPSLKPRLQAALGDRVLRPGLDRSERHPLCRALAREGRHLARHRSHRDGGRAQHRGVAGVAGDGEDARHRHPADHGHARRDDSPHLHVAGDDDWRDRDGGRGDSRSSSSRYVADRYQLIKMPADVYQISHLPFRVQPLDVVIVVAAALGSVWWPRSTRRVRRAGSIRPKR